MTTTLYEFGDLYHNYSIFGVKNHQKAGIFKENQESKAPIISAYISLAIAKVKDSGNKNISFAELFCADAYYAMLALHFGVSRSIGIDTNQIKHSDKSEDVAKKIGLDGFSFVPDDVNNIDKMAKIDIVANVGGLYHVSNPKEILLKSYNMANDYLIIQSVVSMENNNPDYFISPAPDWDWGCRFSRESFDKMVSSFGWDIMDRHFNELTGNKGLHDRGSAYYLVRK